MKGIFKNRLFYIVILFVSICLFLVAGTALQWREASAATTEKIVFELGASARVDSQGQTSGLRFTAKMDGELYEELTEEVDGKLAWKSGVEVGMIIVPATYITAFEKAGATDYFDFYTTQTTLKKEDISTQFEVTQLRPVGDGSYYMRGALIKLYEKNYTREFRAVSYYIQDGKTNYFLHADARSVQQVAISAIQDEQAGQLQYTDGELNILHGYANGEVARVIYDAKNPNHFPTYDENGNVIAEGKFQSVNSLEGIGKGHSAKIEQTTEDGEQVFKITVLNAGTPDENGFGAISLDWSLENIDANWVNIYNHISFDIWASRGGLQCAFTDDVMQSPFGETGFESVLTTKGRYNVLPYELQEYQGKIHMSVLGVQAGDIVYISSFTAHSIRSIQNRINALPTEGYITPAQKVEADNVRMDYESIREGEKTVGSKADIDVSRLDSCERLPIKIYDMSNPTTLNSFAMQNLTAYEASWKGSLSLEDGWLKIHATEVTEGTNGETSVAVSYNFDSIFDEQDSYAIGFLVKSTRANTRCGCVDYFNNSEQDEWHTQQSANEVLEKVYFMNGLFEMSANGVCYLTAKNVQAGDSVYMGDFIAHNKESLEDLIFSLKTEGDYTEEEKAKIDEAERFSYFLNNQISEEAKERLARIVTQNLFDGIPEGEEALTVAEKRNLTAARASYDGLSDANKALFDETKLIQAESLPMLAFNASIEGGENIFLPLQVGEKKWIGNVTRELVDNEWCYAFTATKEDDAADDDSAIAFGFTVEGIDWTGYTAMAYSCWTSETAGTITFGLGNAASGEGIEGVGFAEATTTKQNLPAPIKFVIESAGMRSFIINGLKPGETFYYSSFVAFGEKTVAAQVENLPASENITEGDRKAVETARQYYNILWTNDLSVTGIDVAKLEACEAKLEKL